MVSRLIVLCLLVIALCRAARPPMVVVVKSAIGVVTYPPVPPRRAEGDGVREDAGLPEDPDQRGPAQVVKFHQAPALALVVPLGVVARTCQ